MSESKKERPLSDIEKVLIKGDLAPLNVEQKLNYVAAMCKELGLNPLLRPFGLIEFKDGKVLPYALKSCTEQLRDGRGLSISIVARENLGDVYRVAARVSDLSGRTDEDVGVVSMTKEGGEWATAQSGKKYFKGNGVFKPLTGDDLANAIMKAETKAKRRATLSFCGMGMLDESEVHTIQGAKTYDVETETKSEPAKEPESAKTETPFTSQITQLAIEHTAREVFEMPKRQSEELTPLPNYKLRGAKQSTHHQKMLNEIPIQWLQKAVRDPVWRASLEETDYNVIRQFLEDGAGEKLPEPAKPLAEQKAAKKAWAIQPAHIPAEPEVEKRSGRRVNLSKGSDQLPTMNQTPLEDDDIPNF